VSAESAESTEVFALPALSPAAEPSDSESASVPTVPNPATVVQSGPENDAESSSDPAPRTAEGEDTQGEDSQQAPASEDEEASDEASSNAPSAATQREEQERRERPQEARAQDPPPQKQSEQQSKGQQQPEQATPERRVEARAGNEFTVRLPGDGWIYLGSAGDADIVRFEGKEVVEDETVFSFRAEKSGDYELRFQQQDVVSGTMDRTAVALEVSEGSDSPMAADGAEAAEGGEAGTAGNRQARSAADQQDAGQQAAGAEGSSGTRPEMEPREALEVLEQTRGSARSDSGGTASGGTASADGPGQTTGGDTESGAGPQSKQSEEYRRAIRSLTGASQDVPAELRQEIAAQAAALGEHGLAAEYWNRNASEENVPRDLQLEALRRLLDLRISQEDAQRADEALQRLTEAGELPEESTLLELGDMRREEGNTVGAIELYEQYLARNRDAPRADYVHYMLGQLYEQESKRRSMKRALENYEIVTDHYPLSRYFDEAQERAQYIDRHFFTIR
jgi:hypothetical protein